MEAKDLADRDVAAFNEQDIEAKLRYSSPDIELVVPGATLHGAEQMASFAHALWEAFPDGRITSDKRVAEGSTAIIEGTFTGTHVGTLATPAGDIAPTGRRICLPCVAIYDVAGGRITSKRFWFDRLELLTQIGEMLTPARA